MTVSTKVLQSWKEDCPIGKEDTEETGCPFFHARVLIMMLCSSLFASFASSEELAEVNQRPRAVVFFCTGDMAESDTRTCQRPKLPAASESDTRQAKEHG
jgi:hypothetical protein